MEFLTLLLVLAIGGLFAAYWCSRIAAAKGWNSDPWIWWGLLFAPFALIAAAGLPDKKAQNYLRHLAYGDRADAPLPTPPLVS